MTLHIAEKATSIWSYHLHESEESVCGRMTALCGEEFIGWDTKIPLSSWGVRNNVPWRVSPATNRPALPVNGKRSEV